MADDARHTRPDLSAQEGAAPDPARLDFFELLRRLETDGARFGRAGGPAREPARLGQAPRLGFAVSDLSEVTPRDGDVPFIGVNVIGLLGPEGPMPLHLTRWTMRRLSNRWFAGDTGGAVADTSFIDFVNMLQHRMIALYWRSWAEARPDVQLSRADGGRVSALMQALAGLGLPGTGLGEDGLDGAVLHHATSLAQQVHAPERLTAFLETVLHVPVQIDEFLGVWIDLPERLQTRLGGQNAVLGHSAVAGRRVFDRQGHAELRAGPLSFAEFEALLEDGARRDRLRRAVLFAAGHEMRFRLRLVLAAGEAPQARIGSVRLGRTAWLCPDPAREADDYAVSRITADRREAA